MADLITSFTGSDGLIDNRVRVVSSSIARQMSIGSNWNVLRIGVRFVFEDPGADIVNYPRVAFGLCSGTSSLFNLSGSNANHFLGICSALNTSATSDPQAFTYKISSGASEVCGPNYWNVWGSNSAGFPFTRIWLVQTGSLAFENDVGIHIGNISANSSTRSAVILQYSKSSQGMTVTGYGPANFCGTFDMTITALEQSLTQVAPPITASGYQTLTLASNLNVSESLYGSLDTINFYWNKPFPSIYISDIMATKIS